MIQLSVRSTLTVAIFLGALLTMASLETQAFDNESSRSLRAMTDLQKADTLFNWLEALFPEIVPPGQHTQEIEGIIYRYYPTDVYLATYLGDLYYIGSGTIIPLGDVNALISLVPGEEPRPGQTKTDPVTGMEFVWVPGGCYQMGCGSWTDSCYDSELPVHEVCLDGFWMGKYEVTQGQWTQIMGSNPSHFRYGDNYPVEQVTWDDIQSYITALNSLGSHTFRLPTEAEWEYAARSGGRDEKYAGGDDLDSLGWYDNNSGGRTHAVGTKAANGLGIYDMSGNVWEWVSDWYDGSYYSVSPRDNPQGPSEGYARVVRGGSYSYSARSCRVADRYSDWPDFGDLNMGFRLALSPVQSK